MLETKEEAIKNKIEEITGYKPKGTSDLVLETGKHLRPFSIKKILLLASSYNYFLLEEEGRIEKLFQHIYPKDLPLQPPEITQVESLKNTKQHLDNDQFDLFIIFNEPQESDLLSFTNEIKQTHPDLPIVYLANHTAQLQKLIDKDNYETIDRAFTWNGDGSILLTIIQLFEDQTNIQSNPSCENKEIILLIEDDIQYYSSYLLLIYEELWKYTQDLMHKDLTLVQKNRRYQRRPFILHTTDFDEANALLNQYTNHLLCIISDNNTKNTKDHAGITLAAKIHNLKPNIPAIIQSSEPKQTEKLPENAEFISKTNSQLRKRLRTLVSNSLGPVTLHLQHDKQRMIINTLSELEKTLLNNPANTFSSIVKTHQISKWLFGIQEKELATKIKDIENNETDVSRFHQRIIDTIEEYNYSLHQATVTDFSRKIKEPQSNINRMGDGSLGGKARGLAFLAKILSKYITEEMFPNLKITIPRTIVLSTEIFDKFIEKNDFPLSELFNLSDERIAAHFLKANLPATILGDLRAFVRNTRKPLIVRSSGMLEDSLFQPFAGIYASVLLPNESWETDLRFQEVCNSIKYVYSSTYFSQARTYIQSTPKHIADEKMAILLQEVVGQKHGKYFYPTVAGVAKSYNHYPAGPCSPEEGIVYLSLGLGKAIVDGGSSYCFCPKRPKTPLCGTPKDFLPYSQKKFYAIDLTSFYKTMGDHEENSLAHLDVDLAKEHGTLNALASTYSHRDDRIYPGIEEDGYLVINFAPLLQFNTIPLAKAMELLLSISEIALGYPVEIEFALNIPKEEDTSAELVILQIRNMMPPSETEDVDLKDFSKEDVICYSENALGNGTITDIKDIVYVDPETFDMGQSQQIVPLLRDINLKLMNQNKPYLLIGPGRWGSADPWLGIPVIWSDIAGAKAIIETPVKEKTIEPSQGSHFFHDMVSSQVGYLITQSKKSILNWDYLSSLPKKQHKDSVYHVHTDEPLSIHLDGRNRKGIIVKNENHS
ncbi:MAG: hypothetical protein KGY65_06820 [Candidatus Thermoplasmatota archaeon]|nr:hypothetical protein [Candidatus Thermoplasmatota archaeon]MBS3802446.1 hypothetical protein [Candidatus Thermoplasmatota archaeon]